MIQLRQTNELLGLIVVILACVFFPPAGIVLLLIWLFYPRTHIVDSLRKKGTTQPAPCAPPSGVSTPEATAAQEAALTALHYENVRESVRVCLASGRTPDEILAALKVRESDTQFSPETRRAIQAIVWEEYGKWRAIADDQ